MLLIMVGLGPMRTVQDGVRQNGGPGFPSPFEIPSGGLPEGQEKAWHQSRATIQPAVPSVRQWSGDSWRLNPAGALLASQEGKRGNKERDVGVMTDAA